MMMSPFFNYDLLAPELAAILATTTPLVIVLGTDRLFLYRVPVSLALIILIPSTGHLILSPFSSEST